MTLTAIDLFAGAGGFTTGAAQAGANVLWASNHCPLAVDIHRANHPAVDHACQDLMQADFTRVPDHDVLLASPACQGHTPARGRERPHHDASRSTAWAVVQCAEVKRPRYVLVENVPAFRKWVLFPAWVAALQALGYELQTRELDAADFGVPQNRRRLFVVGHRGRRPFLPWGSKAHIPAGEIIDWSIESWSPIRKPGRAQATIDRWKHGAARYGPRFLMPYYSAGSGITGRPLDRPIGTITTISRWALVDGDHMRMLAVPELRRAMGFPDSYVLPDRKRDAERLLGNAVPPPMAAALVGALA